MGNPIFTTAEAQFSRIKLVSESSPQTYAEVASRIDSIRTTRRTRQTAVAQATLHLAALNNQLNPNNEIFISESTRPDIAEADSRGATPSRHEQYPNTNVNNRYVENGPNPLFGQNEHPLRALLTNAIEPPASNMQDYSRNNNRSRVAAEYQSLQRRIQNTQATATSVAELEDIIMRQLRPRSYSLLFGGTSAMHIGASSGGLLDLPIIEPSLQDYSNQHHPMALSSSDYQTMETVMGRLRRQLRNSSARLSQDTALMHRSRLSNAPNSISNNGPSISVGGTGRSTTPFNSAAETTSARDQLERVRRIRLERIQTDTHLFNSTYARWNEQEVLESGTREQSNQPSRNLDSQALNSLDQLEQRLRMIEREGVVLERIPRPRGL